MFYSQVILARKGPLGKIWLAAHFDKKLTKTQIFSTDISDSVDSVLNSVNPLALRVSGHLMLGIVRIYSRKVKYLCSDCNEALWKIKLAFRPGNVNLLESQLAISNQIDDQRFFGRINADIDFPELADEGFSEAMLTNDATLKAARGRSLASRSDITTQDFYDSRLSKSDFQDHLIMPRLTTSTSSVDKSRRGEDSNVSKESKLSSIEKVRNAVPFLGGDGNSRISYSAAGAAMSMNFDDIPAFEENYDDAGMLAITSNDNQQYDNNHHMPMYDFDEPNLSNDEEIIVPELLSKDAEAEQPKDSQQNPVQQQQQQEDEELISVTAASDAVMMDDEKKKKKKKMIKKKVVEGRKAKKQRVAVDDRVEMTSRACKDMLENVASIMRRHRVQEEDEDEVEEGEGEDDDNQSLPYQVTAAAAAGRTTGTPPLPVITSGLCHELRQVFDMAISRELPFRRQDDGDNEEEEEEESNINNNNNNNTNATTAAGMRNASSSSSLKSPVSAIEKTRKRNPSDLSSGSSRRDAASVTKASPLSHHSRGESMASATGGGGLSISQDMQLYDDNNQYDGDHLNHNNCDDILPEDYGLFSNNDENDHNIAAGLSLSVAPAGGVMDETHSLSALAFNRKGNHSPHQQQSTEEEIGELCMNQDKWNSRTKIVLDILKNQFATNKTAPVSFQSLSQGSTRRVAASCFLEILQLKTWDFIHVTQQQQQQSSGNNSNRRMTSTSFDNTSSRSSDILIHAMAKTFQEIKSR